MKRKRYSAKTKQAILATVKEVRKGGGKWSVALEAAQKVGYKGTAAALYQMIRNAEGGHKRKKRKAGRMAAKANTGVESILASLATHIDKAVNDRLASVIAALAALK